MYYIFLDVDGVLNNKKHYKKLHKKYGGRFCGEQMPFNPKSLKNLKKLVDKTDGRIVLTSSWRLRLECMAVLNARLMEYGLKIYSRTPRIMNKNNTRGREIYEWVKDFNYKIKQQPSNNHVIKHKDMLIIDDQLYDITRYYNSELVVQCNPKYGFNKSKLYEAIDKYKYNTKTYEFFDMP